MEKYPKHSIKLFNLNIGLPWQRNSELPLLHIKLLKKCPWWKQHGVLKFITIEQRYKESPKHLIKLQGEHFNILLLKIIVIKRPKPFPHYLFHLNHFEDFMLFQNNFLWKKTVNYSGLMRNINNIDLKYVWRIPSMAWKEFLHKPSSSCQIDADQHHQCDLICPTYSWEAFKYAKDTWSSLSATANRSKTLGYCFSNTQRTF